MENRGLRMTILAAGLLGVLPAFALNQHIVVSTGSHAVLGSVTVENEDLADCEATSLGENSTTCVWTHLFDGSAAGLNTSVRAVDLLSNGNLVMAVNADGSIPDLSAIKSKDLALFIPTNPFQKPYTSGEWRLYLDGDAVKGASDARVWDAITVLTDGACENDFPPTCDLLLSLPSGTALGGVSFGDEDILRCHPTAHSLGGAITACDYSLFLDSSAINGAGTGSFTGNLTAFETLGSDTLIFRGPSQATLPSHQSSRDLLRYVGTFGTTPIGTVDFYFDGSTAGLDGESIQAMAIAPDLCGNGIVNPPFESCDVGALNGAPGSGCSANCALIGQCTGGGGACSTAADCPPGQGCCGNAVVETPEECDDGNLFTDDTCSSHCTNQPDGVPLLGCENVFGPHLVPAFVKKTQLKNTAGASTPDKWKSTGSFNLASGTGVDPDTELVEYTLNQSSTAIYQANLVPPGKFFQKGKPTSPSWKFLDKTGSTPLALGWTKAAIKQKFNQVKVTVQGLGVEIPIDQTPPIRVRQSLKIGNECATVVLDCTPRGTQTLNCTPAPPFGSASAAFLD